MGLFSGLKSVVSSAWNTAKNFAKDNAGALIGGASGFLGDYLGGRADASATNSANAANVAMQYDFAKNGIQWKVDDAKKAGIHPLYALGAQTMSPSVAIQGSSSKGDSFRSIGQNVSRAVAATQTQEAREQIQLQTENMKLQNTMLKAQIGNEVAKQPKNPPMPSARVIPGQGDSSVPYQAYGYSMNADGSMDITPSQDFTDRNQNVISGIVPEMRHFVRNQLFPSLGGHKDVVTYKGKVYKRRGSTYYPMSPIEVRPSHKR